MCLGIPGQIISLETHEEALFRTAIVQFGSVQRKVSLACLPFAKCFDYILVHAGIAIAIIDTEEAFKIIDLLSTDDEISQGI